jgi:uncharacterized protein
LAERGKYERDDIYAILDEAPFCHVGFVRDDQPFVIPTIHARKDEVLYLHGSPAARMLKGDGEPICVTATLLDGLVLARSAFHSSMNYRSVVVLGRGRRVIDDEEKMSASEAIVEHVQPGRWADCRWPSDEELRKTSFLAIDLNEASAKVRTGPPKDEAEDMDLEHWAGVVPVSLAKGVPQEDPDAVRRLRLPTYLRSSNQ